MGELRPRAPVVELVADVADVTHHRHEEFHTWGTAGSVCSHPPGGPGVPPSLGTRLLPHPPGGRREEDKGIGCLGRMPWLGSAGVTWRLGSGLGSYRMRCWGCRSPGLSASLWICLWASPGNMQCGPWIWLPPDPLPECRWGAWNPPMLLNTLTLISRSCMAFSEPWYMLILPPRVTSAVYTL